jgi:hypothetical protein
MAVSQSALTFGVWTGLDVCFGSLADIATGSPKVRFKLNVPVSAKNLLEPPQR